ncbi:MAG: hypothetical protein OXH00_21640 [Candidatus Poribacteria bacterium]|nr:hypothetical protein [Candidatus Poribacteria bacterium]
MKYKRNWAWECTADVFFTDGTECRADAQTNNKGRLNWIKIDGKHHSVTESTLDALGIQSIHFTTPAQVIR